MAKVFVTQEHPSLNYAPAEEFGEVVFMTIDDYSSIKNSLHNIDLIDELKNTVKEFDPDVDYIVISGSPVVSAIVFMLVGMMYQGRQINVLRWSNRDHMYQPTTINIK